MHTTSSSTALMATEMPTRAQAKHNAGTHLSASIMDSASTSDRSGTSSPERLSPSIEADGNGGHHSWDTHFDEGKVPEHLPTLSHDDVLALSQDKLAALNDQLADCSPVQILRWMRAQPAWGNVVQFTSFGVSGMVITDIMTRLGFLTPIVFVDTLYHFDETLDLKATVEKVYNRQVLAYGPQTSSDRSTFEEYYGQELWSKDSEFYHYLTKVEPTGRALTELEVDVWITGRRRSQGSSRASLAVLEVASDGRIKINPMAHVDWASTWKYVKSAGVPYNKLVDQGYKSIGDVHSTRPVGHDAPERSGRWSGEFRTECGMHTAVKAARRTSAGGSDASETSDATSDSEKTTQTAVALPAVIE